MKSRRKQSLSKRRRWRPLCEPLEPRLLMATDSGLDATNLLASLDSLTFTATADGTAEIGVDTSLASDPGSLAAYAASQEASIDAGSDNASVEPNRVTAPRHN